MPTILTVDDTAEIRSAVSRMLRGCGLEVVQAASGVEGLELLGTMSVDLILLDVMMPEMDGPSMLRALRARGDRTPVIMLTSETSRKLIAGVLPLGVADYIFKPFRPDTLRAKVAKVLGRNVTPELARALAEVQAPEPAATAAGPAARPVIDVLLVDDMDQVHRRLRQALPEHVTMQAAGEAADAVALVMPDADSFELLRQLRALQPQARFLAVSLRTLAEARDELLAAGFVDVLYKPFDPDAITALVHRVFDARELVETHGDVVVANGCEARDERIEEHHARLRPALLRAVEAVAAGGHPEVLVDLRQVPVRAERTIRMVMDLDRDARRLGLRLRLIASPDAASLLRRVADTADLDVFDSVGRARAA
jgi:DNA-binding response OmpR family regulator